MVTRFTPAATIVVCLILSCFSTSAQTPSPGYAGTVPPVLIEGGGAGGGGGIASLPGARAMDIYVLGNYAYAVTDQSELYIIDVTTPYLPTVASKLTNGSGGAQLNGATGIFVSGNYAYITLSIANALEILDVSNPAAPAHVGNISDSPVGAELSQARDVVVVGNYAYVSAGGGLEIVDVTTKSAPVHKGKITLGFGFPSRGVTVSGSYAYVNSSASLSIVDISDPANPVEKSTIVDNDNTIRIQEPVPPVLNGNYLFMTSSGDNTLEVFDVSNVTNPVPAGFLTNNDNGSVIVNPAALSISGNYAYLLSAGANVLEVIDISTPASPVHAAKAQSSAGFTFLANPFSSFVSGNYIFTSSGSGFEVFYIFTPSPPTKLTPAASEVGGFTAKWSAVQNVTEYQLDVSDDDFATFLPGYNSLSLGPSVTSKDITGLNSSKIYKYRVRASNGNGTSPSSVEFSTPPTAVAPVAKAATDVGQTTITATWDAVDNALGYKLDLTTDNTFTVASSVIFFNADVSTTSFEINGLDPGKVYYYRVRAVNILGASGNSNIISQLTLPPVPATSIPSPIKQTSFTAKWSAAVGASEYFVDVFDAEGNILDGYDNVSVPGGTSLAVEGLEAGTNYSFVVRAKNSSGTTESSTKQEVLTLPPTPVAKSAEISGTVYFIAHWEASQSATKYHISVFNDNGSEVPGYSGFDAGDALSATITINAPTTGALYSYKVNATNASGSSPYSDAVYVNTPATSFASIMLPTGGTVESYMIVSIPDGTTAATALASESFAKTWRVMQYNNSSDTNEDIRNVADMKPGKGYWVNSNLDEAPSITLSGQTTPTAKKITLLPGWNQIGNPLNYDISWTDVLAQNSDITGIGNLFTYNVPVSGFNQNDELKAYGGGFVNSTNTASVELTVPSDIAASSARAGKTDVIGDRDIAGSEWFLPLELEVSGMKNTLGGIGMHPKANNSIDKFDAIALPRFFNFTEISSNHPEFFQSRFMRDVVTTASAHTWRLDIISSDGGEMTLSWNNSGWTGGALFLIDDDAGVLLDMSSTDRYKCNRNRSLRLAFSSDGHFEGEVSALGLPYPNPSGGVVKFPFIASDGEPVSIRIFDLTGRTVHQFTNNRIGSGYHEVAWDAKGDGNLASGIYLFHAQTSNGKYKTGRIVIR